MLLISDANIFIDLYKVGLLSFINYLDIEIATSDFVFNELNKEQKKVIKTLNVKIYELDANEMIIFFDNYKNLGQKAMTHQDYSIFYFAMKYNGHVLSNDKALRTFSKKQNIEIKGIFYIIDLIIKKNCITSSNMIEILKKLLENTWLPREQIIKRIDCLK